MSHALREHAVIIGRKYSCGICGCQAARKLDFLKHVASMYMIIEHKCVMCEQTYKTKRLARRHARQHHDLNWFMLLGSRCQ